MMHRLKLKLGLLYKFQINLLLLFSNRCLSNFIFKVLADLKRYSFVNSALSKAVVCPWSRLRDCCQQWLWTCNKLAALLKQCVWSGHWSLTCVVSVTPKQVDFRLHWLFRRH